VAIVLEEAGSLKGASFKEVGFAGIAVVPATFVVLLEYFPITIIVISK